LVPAKAGIAKAAATKTTAALAMYVPKCLYISVDLLSVRLRKAVGEFSKGIETLSWPCRGT
jgi:hypothetical protein